MQKGNKEAADSIKYKYEKRFNLEFSRNVNYLWAMVGSCKPYDEYDEYPEYGKGYILDARSSYNNRFSSDEFAISIQTSNTPLDYSANTFNMKPACFKFGEYSETFLKYLDAPSAAYTKVLDSIFVKLPTSNNNPGGSLGSYSYSIFYEYRNDAVKDIEITADVPLFSRKPGEDLSDKFNIVLFYMTALGSPSYMISSASGKVEYAASKGMVKHISDQTSMYASPAQKLHGVTYEPYITTDINLKEWAKGNYYADPALYVQFAQKPAELPCNATFTVTLTTADKKLTSTTPAIALY